MTIDQALAEARTSLKRLTAAQAREAQRQGALLVDIRPDINRRTEGEIPDAIVIDRNVLEWRLDPASGARRSEASYDAWIVVFCNEGYASSLAAASLQALGIERATDVVGGYRAWRAAGFPVTAVRPG
jgi:rhodanese-related sulfurtransferase